MFIKEIRDRDCIVFGSFSKSIYFFCAFFASDGEKKVSEFGKREGRGIN